LNIKFNVVYRLPETGKWVKTETFNTEAEAIVKRDELRAKGATALLHASELPQQFYDWMLSESFPRS
jgi:hypothetical protein